MASELQEIKGAIAAVQGLLGIYKPLQRAEEFLTALGKIAATRDKLESDIKKIGPAKEKAEGELNVILKKIENMRLAHDKEMEAGKERIVHWLEDAKSKAVKEAYEYKQALEKENEEIEKKVEHMKAGYRDLEALCESAKKKLSVLEDKIGAGEKKYENIKSDIETMKDKMRKMAGM